MHSSKEAAMDEYLFLVAAKLKADRQKLEREQRRQLELDAPSFADGREPRASGARVVFPKFEWREQS
jgi:hypothetical protein